MMRMVLAAALVTAGASIACADDSPAGNWKWSFERNGQTFETKLSLKLDGDKLSGAITGRDGKETAIEEASYKDGEISFSITRERNGNKVTTKYSGKLAGDTITGKSQTGDNSRDWKADRVK
jgi:hypothetical protein